MNQVHPARTPLLPIEKIAELCHMVWRPASEPRWADLPPDDRKDTISLAEMVLSGKRNITSQIEEDIILHLSTPVETETQPSE